MGLPIVCTLTEEELRERRRTVLEAVARAVQSITRMHDGYAYSFEPNSEVLTQLGRLVELERQCCRFLTFNIVENGRKPIRLEITGPPDALPVIEDLFGGPSGPEKDPDREPERGL